MSYILDALRRADAERERGAVPSLHAQQQFALGAGDGETEGRPKTLWWVIAGLALALIALLAWNLLGGSAQNAAVAPAPAPVQPVTAAPPAAGPAQPSPSPPPVAAVAPPPAPAAVNPAPPATARAPHRTARTPKAGADDDAPADARAARRAATRPEPRARARTDEPAGSDTATRRAGPAAEAAAPRGREATPEARRVAEAPRTAEQESGRVVSQRELPEDVRRALPNFKIGGSTYSSDPSSRMLMINGQIFREGDAVAAGLVLKQIRPKGAVFEFRGHRYEMGF